MKPKPLPRRTFMTGADEQGQLEVIIFNSTENQGAMFFLRAENVAYLPSIQSPGITTETETP